MIRDTQTDHTDQRVRAPKQYSPTYSNQGAGNGTNCSDVRPWPWSLRPKSRSLALALTPQVLGLGLGLVT